MSAMPRGRNHFKAKWLEMEDGNGDRIGSYLRRVDDFSCECTRCSKVIAVANLGLSAIHRHVKTLGHVSRSQGHVKLHATDEVNDQLITENKTEVHTREFSKHVLLDKTIERLDDIENLVSCVEEQLRQYQRLHFVLSVLEEKNATIHENHSVKNDLEAKLETSVKEEGSCFIDDNINAEDSVTQVQTLSPKNRNARRGKNHFNDKWLEDIDTNGNNLKTYMEQHDEFSVWCYLCERAIATDNQGQTAIMRHIKSQKHRDRLIKCQAPEQNTEDRFKSTAKEKTFDCGYPELSVNHDVYEEENFFRPNDSIEKVIKKRGINHVKNSWFERMDSNGDLVSLYLRREGEHRVLCRWCERSINTTNIGYVAIRRHFQSQSHRAVANMIPEKAAFSDGDLDVRNTEFVCDTCGDCLQGLLKFRKHLRKHLADKQVKFVKEHSCPFCNTKIVVNYRTFLKHKRMCEVQHAVGEDFMCSGCGQSFPTHHMMYKHHYRCSGRGSGKPRHKKPCPYEGCDYSSYLSRDLENHVNRVHLKKPLSRDFGCHLCGKTYNRKHQLDQHVRGDHMNDKPHKCQTCDKAFVRRDKLVQHEATHTGEMRYKCPHCEKPFINHGTMWSHKKMCDFNLKQSLT